MSLGGAEPPGIGENEDMDRACGRERRTLTGSRDRKVAVRAALRECSWQGEATFGGHRRKSEMTGAHVRDFGHGDTGGSGDAENRMDSRCEESHPLAPQPRIPHFTDLPTFSIFSAKSMQ